jgi:hypothetical protein
MGTQNTMQSAAPAIYKALSPQKLQAGELDRIVARMKASILREWDFLANDAPATTDEPNIFVGLQTIAPYNITISVKAKNVSLEKRKEACEWIAQEVTTGYKHACAAKLKNDQPQQGA